MYDDARAADVREHRKVPFSPGRPFVLLREVSTRFAGSPDDDVVAVPGPGLARSGGSGVH